MTVAAIHAEGVSKAFRGQRVLDGVGLSVEPGERIALVGPNGAGKTTLIRCLLGEYHFKGRLSLAGRSPRAHRTEVLRRVGFVPQLPPPLRMSVSQLIRFTSDLCGRDGDSVEGEAARLGLDVSAVRHQAFVRLSGGQKQKLLIAIALRRETDLLIMDEPAANLDPQARRVLFELLAERGPQTTMLISSHRLDEVAALVGRVVELDRGRVVLDDRITGTGSLDAVMDCRIELRRPDAGLRKAVEAWGFRATPDAVIFEGTIASPDRLRFLGMLARYSGLVSGVHLEERDGPGKGG
jgi:ABC-2 type transport system ATP-binding protein